MGMMTNLDANLVSGECCVARLATRDPWIVPPEVSLAELVDNVFLKHAISFVPVVENGKLLGYVDTQIVRNIDREYWTTTTVDDVVESTNEGNTVSSDMSVARLAAKISRTGRRKFLVTDTHGLVGVIALSDLTTLLKVTSTGG